MCIDKINLKKFKKNSWLVLSTCYILKSRKINKGWLSMNLALLLGILFWAIGTIGCVIVASEDYNKKINEKNFKK